MPTEEILVGIFLLWKRRRARTCLRGCLIFEVAFKTYQLGLNRTASKEILAKNFTGVWRSPNECFKYWYVHKGCTHLYSIFLIFPFPLVLGLLSSRQGKKWIYNIDIKIFLFGYFCFNFHSLENLTFLCLLSSLVLFSLFVPSSVACPQHPQCPQVSALAFDLASASEEVLRRHHRQDQSKDILKR